MHAILSQSGHSVAPIGSGDRILVIKLGALGDFVLALGAMRTIRRHHASARLTLLTAPAFAPLVMGSGLFDAVWEDVRPRWRDLRGWWSVRKRLITGRFRRVYDLQNNDRTAFYYRLLGPWARPEWSGSVRGCSHRFEPPQPLTHASDWPRAQLKAAGLGDPDPPHLDWLSGDPDRFEIKRPFVLIVPGCAPHRPEKRWLAARFASLGQRLAKRGLTPVLIGTDADRSATASIAAACAAAIDLTGQTTLADIAGLAREADGAVGNDTGPMHLIAVCGCPTLVLFSDASDPQISRPVGADVDVLHRSRLADVTVAEVEAKIRLRTGVAGA